MTKKKKKNPKKVICKTPKEKFQICKERIEKIEERLIEAIHLHEMCENIIFSKHLKSQIPKSYAAHSYNLLEQTLIRQYALLLCTLWDNPRNEKDDKISFPMIISLIDDKVVTLAEEESYNYWYSTNQDSDCTYPDAVPQEEIVAFHKKIAGNHSSYIAPSLYAVIDRMEKFVNSKLISRIRNFRNVELAHYLDKKTYKNVSDNNDRINWDSPKKLLFLSLWCYEKLSLGLCGSNASFKEHIKIAKLYNEDLWLNCKFDIPEKK